MQIPSSQSASASASTRRAAYGAPEAPVMPRKTRKRARSLRPLLRFEEHRHPLQVGLAVLRERRHRRSLVDAARALQVGDLEGDALVLRSLGGEVPRAEGRRADVEICVAVEAARGG